jgi:hypothetical protein
MFPIIRNHAHAFPRVPDIEDGEVRRALIRRFHSWIIFEVKGDETIVLSVWDTRRKPTGWSD